MVARVPSAGKILRIVGKLYCVAENACERLTTRLVAGGQLGLSPIGGVKSQPDGQSQTARERQDVDQGYVNLGRAVAIPRLSPSLISHDIQDVV